MPSDRHAYMAAYCQAHKEQLKEQKAAYYQAHKEQLKEQKAAYRQAHKEQRRADRHLPRAEILKRIEQKYGKRFYDP